VFNRKTAVGDRFQSDLTDWKQSPFVIENLESRRLLSACSGMTTSSQTDASAAVQVEHHASQAAANTTTFSSTSTAVQDGLQAIAPSGTTIDASQTVNVRTVNSTTTYYSVSLTNSSGPKTRLTVDENGLPAGNEKVLFSQLSSGPTNDQAIATGLQALAPSGTTIAGTATVFVRSSQGNTTFTVALLNSNGTITRIAVDSTGASTTPTHVPTTNTDTVEFSAAPSAVQAGLQAIAPSGTTISSTQTVNIQTVNATTSYYSVSLTNSSGPNTRLTVDENGLPVGNETVLFSQLSAGPANDASIASALQNLAPTGTTIAADQSVIVRTSGGQTTYTVRLTNSNGTETIVTVDSAGNVVTRTMPTFSTIQFSAAPSAVQAGLQAIAPSGTTISGTQNVYVLTVNSTTSYYTVNLPASSSSTSTAAWNSGTRLTVDENGLPAGNQQILYSQLAAGPANDQVISTALQNLAPSGTTIAGTQTVQVNTTNGETTFTVELTGSNSSVTEITVDSSGDAVSSPSGGGGGSFNDPTSAFPVGGLGGLRGHFGRGRR
jgi:uncharacterized protein YpmB